MRVYVLAMTLLDPNLPIERRAPIVIVRRTPPTTQALAAALASSPSLGSFAPSGIASVLRQAGVTNAFLADGFQVARETFDPALAAYKHHAGLLFSCSVQETGEGGG